MEKRAQQDCQLSNFPAKLDVFLYRPWREKQGGCRLAFFFFFAGFSSGCGFWSFFCTKTANKVRPHLICLSKSIITVYIQFLYSVSIIIGGNIKNLKMLMLYKIFFFIHICFLDYPTYTIIYV